MASTIQAYRYDLFPTAIWQFEQTDCAALNQELLGLIRAEQARDGVGLRNRSSVNGWHSQLDLHTRPDFRRFVELMNQAAATVIQFQKWDLKRITPVITECWAVVNGKYGSNQFHRHPHANISGVYYVQTPEKCGALIFRDPRPVAAMMAPPVTQRTAWTELTRAYQPQAGKMLLFPSWLEHGVGVNESDEERIAISFNVSFRIANPLTPVPSTATSETP
jgi:uncharacterized protein (TIGR02466 family)